MAPLRTANKVLETSHDLRATSVAEFDPLPQIGSVPIAALIRPWSACEQILEVRTKIEASRNEDWITAWRD